MIHHRQSQPLEIYLKNLSWCPPPLSIPSGKSCLRLEKGSVAGSSSFVKVLLAGLPSAAENGIAEGALLGRALGVSPTMFCAPLVQVVHDNQWIWNVCMLIVAEVL